MPKTDILTLRGSRRSGVDSCLRSDQPRIEILSEAFGGILILAASLPGNLDMNVIRYASVAALADDERAISRHDMLDDMR
jgi:hypothetical protein